MLFSSRRTFLKKTKKKQMEKGKKNDTRYFYQYSPLYYKYVIM